jgi:hypothetical protein
VDSAACSAAAGAVIAAEGGAAATAAVFVECIAQRDCANLTLRIVADWCHMEAIASSLSISWPDEGPGVGAAYLWEFVHARDGLLAERLN